MATKAAFKRLSKEYNNLQRNPPPYLMAKPLESNILEWHYVIRGPPETPYHNGEYHGVLLFPAEYPFKPPSIRMTTPSGRFQPDTRLCLSMSDFHPSTWNPAWSVPTILTGLLSFMVFNEATTGSIKTTDADKRIYATRSHQFNLNNPKFKEIFPELCVSECVPVEVLYPIHNSSSSNNIATNGNEISQNDKQFPQVARRNETNQQVPLVDGRNQIQQRRLNNRNENPLRGIVAGGTLAAHTENANNNLNRANGSNNPQGNTNNNVAGQRGIFDQWRKWIIVSLVCLYLVITKLLARSSGGEPSM
ncbi:8770_t:CDS:2 [Funneliformis mosseae]|uniref:Ubiquitin-conjugating enzyme E2 6 n=1 Tax=Funneliformis mosseae TaxID=27381 RepID=A0A9N8YIV4_FUNMO|nr:8770_t:CDS:2 [Funneliformis mosseae]